MNSPLPTTSLCLYGDDLDPEIVTRTLGVSPSASHKKGESFHAPSGKIRTAKTGAWLLFDTSKNSENLEQSVRLVLQAIRYHGDLLRIPNVSYATIAVAVALSDQPEIGSLPPDVIQRIAALGANLSIEVYQEK